MKSPACCRRCPSTVHAWRTRFLEDVHQHFEPDVDVPERDVTRRIAAVSVERIRAALESTL
jgi:hypothetical protein